MKTGRQVFEDVLATIDNTINVKEIISAGVSSFTFTVCSAKWIMVGTVFNVNGIDWQVATFNPDTLEITSLVPASGATIAKRDILYIQMPIFKSGTPLNLENEWNLAEKSGVFTVYPIVWLRETITGKGYNRQSSIAKEFNYTFYALTYSNVVDWYNEDRHVNGVIPMTNLADAVIEAFDLYYGTTLEDGYSIKEFNIFGKESEDGFISYLLSKNLSGLEYKPTVKVTREACDC